MGVKFYFLDSQASLKYKRLCVKMVRKRSASSGAEKAAKSGVYGELYR